MKRAIIIGATSGIGREVAIRLIEQGWWVGLTGRRYEELLSLQTRYGADRVTIARMDVTAAEATEALDEVIALMGAPDLLLYASGIGRQNRELDSEVEIATIRTNCEGMARILTHFLRFVRQEPSYTPSHKAHVAVITSVAGTTGIGSAPAYSATKSMQSTYLTALSQLCRMEHLPVRFTDIRPGFVATAILNPDKHYPMMMSVEQAASHILHGLERGRRIITFDWRYRLLVALWRLIPRAVWERMTFIKN